MSTCGTCGQPMDPARATYNKSGVLQCPSCAATTTIAEGDARAGASVMGSAAGVLVGGILSVTCFNPMMIVSIITLLSGVGWLAMVARNPSLRAKLGGRFVWGVLMVSIGLMLGAVYPGLFALAALGFAATSIR